VIQRTEHIMKSPVGTPRASAIATLAEPAPGVALWWCDLERRARDAQLLTHVLSAAERERAARFGTDLLRDRWIAGRATLRELLGVALDLAAADVPLRRGRRGRPEIAIDGAPDFNVSHTEGVALIAIGVALAPDIRIGIDVERDDRDVAADRLAQKFLAPPERALLKDLDADARRRRFLRAWTYKEAMSKATGDGLIAPFRELHVDIGGSPRLVSGPAPYEPAAWELATASVPTDHLGAVALWHCPSSRT